MKRDLNFETNDGGFISHADEMGGGYIVSFLNNSLDGLGLFSSFFTRNRRPSCWDSRSFDNPILFYTQVLYLAPTRVSCSFKCAAS